jgi:ABC-type oligopeptide transport system substrate-binding subunit
MRLRVTITALLAVALAAAALTACGGSSKPGYCSDVSDFKSAVGDLKDVNLSKDGVDGFTSAAQKVETTGTALVSSAKSEFASETSALKSSLASMQTSISQLSSTSTAPDALKQLPLQAAAVGSAAKSLSDAASSKCK